MKKSLKDQKKLNKIEMLKKGFEVPNQKKRKRKRKRKVLFPPKVLMK